MLWSVVWLTALIVVLSPPTTSKMANFLGIGRGVDFVLYVSLAILFYLVFRLYVMIEDLRHEITYLVRQIALQNPSKKPKRRRRT